MFKLQKKEPENINSENQDLIRDIELLNRLLEKQEQKFNLTVDDDLLDSLIFEHISLEKRYHYLLKKAKEQKIEIPYHERSKYI